MVNLEKNTLQTECRIAGCIGTGLKVFRAYNHNTNNSWRKSIISNGGTVISSENKWLHVCANHFQHSCIDEKGNLKCNTNPTVNLGSSTSTTDNVSAKIPKVPDSTDDEKDKKIAELTAKVKLLRKQTESIDSMIDSIPNLQPQARNFLKMCANSEKIKIYTKSQIGMASKLFFANPKCYRVLRNEFGLSLPSEDTFIVADGSSSVE